MPKKKKNAKGSGQKASATDRVPDGLPEPSKAKEATTQPPRQPCPHGQEEERENKTTLSADLLELCDRIFSDESPSPSVLFSSAMRERGAVVLAEVLNRAFPYGPPNDTIPDIIFSEALKYACDTAYRECSCATSAPAQRSELKPTGAAACTLENGPELQRRHKTRRKRDANDGSLCAGVVESGGDRSLSIREDYAMQWLELLS
ncbi:hypothetical protein B0A50_03644 [Salinomyces thailandicus]|uniref:Uncharacterized protein n=1 Tax=Salinomyces thailandicus TaxID=706561 RepID=A0A4U0U2Y0_9PEZI|nr:hypothetical protein B0A50_03644 [Salinomyces thailandica]